MGEEVVEADEDFFAFHKVGGVEVVVDAAAVVAGAGHVFAASADDAVVEREVLVFAVEFADEALDEGDAPACGQLVEGEHFEQFFVPEVLAFAGSLRCCFLPGEGEVALEAEVEVVLEYILPHFLEYLFVFCLVDHPVEVLVFEWDEVYVPDAVHLFPSQRCYCIGLAGHC